MSCACLLTMVAEYHLVSLVLLIRTLENPSLKPGPEDTAHLSKLFLGFTQSRLRIRGIVPCCDVLSNSQKSCLDAIKNRDLHFETEQQCLIPRGIY